MEINPAVFDASALYDAAMRGSTETLQSLIQRDNLILKKFPLSSFTETPLHISVLAGHLDFTRELVHHDPGMAMEVDSSNCTPLHLASAAGHTEIVRALLSVGSDACLVRDEDGRIPLHFAAMRGRVDIIEELVSARPESVSEKLDDDGDTVLHLCVKYNHLEALKLLVQMSSSTGKMDIESIIRVGDQDGNTILHLAAMFKQLQTTSYLASLPSMGAAVNAINGLGSTALDCLELCPKDFKSLRIRDLLLSAGGKRSKELTSTHVHLPPPPPPSQQSTSSSSATNECCRPMKSMCRRFKQLLKHESKWMEEMKEEVLVVATLLASMSFQAAINPPGGVWQENFTSPDQGLACNSTSVCIAGTAVLGYAMPELLYTFVELNTMTFGASLAVILLIIGGFPLKNKFLVWLMSQAMCGALTSTTAAFVIAVWLVTPEGMLVNVLLTTVLLLLVWFLLDLVIGLLDALRFLIWIWNKLRKVGVGRALASCFCCCSSCCLSEDHSATVV